MQSTTTVSYRRRCARVGFASVLMVVTSGVAMAKNEKTPAAEVPVFDRTKFERSTVVDNKYHPLVPVPVIYTRGRCRKAESASRIASCGR